MRIQVPEGQTVELKHCEAPSPEVLFYSDFDILPLFGSMIREQ
jgi:hypothetical protein